MYKYKLFTDTDLIFVSKAYESKVEAEQCAIKHRGALEIINDNIIEYKIIED